jgi:hypothetical protein
MPSWLKEGKYWVNLGGKEETSTRGRLLQLLPKVENAMLRVETSRQCLEGFQLMMYCRTNLLTQELIDSESIQHSCKKKSAR